MDDIWPKHYVKLPFPDFGGDKQNREQTWHGIVADRARILDPDFHGGKTEAIRLIVDWKEVEVKLPPRMKIYASALRFIREPVIGEWIEFRNFKEANAFVQAYKRLGK